jgi:hypothetical protein
MFACKFTRFRHVRDRILHRRRRWLNRVAKQNGALWREEVGHRISHVAFRRACREEQLGL